MLLNNTLKISTGILAAQALMMANGFLFLSYSSFHYQPQVFGDIALLLIILSLFNSLYSKKTLLSISRFAPLLRGNPIVRPVLIHLAKIIVSESVMTSIGATLLFCLWHSVAKPGGILHLDSKVLLVSAFAFLSCNNISLFTLLRALGNRRYTILLQSITPLLRIFIIALFLLHGSSPSLLLAFVLEAFLTQLLLLTFMQMRYFKVVPVKLSPEMSSNVQNMVDSFSTFRNSIGFTLPLALWIFDSFSKWILQLFHGAPALGSYSMLQQVSFTPLVAATYLLISCLTPYYFSKKDEEALNLLQPQLSLPKQTLIKLSVLILLFICLFPFVVTSMISSAYGISYVDLWIMLASALLFSLAELGSQVLLRLRNIAELKKRIMYTLLFNLFLSTLLIPSMGESGATISLLFSSGFYLINVIIPIERLGFKI